MERKKKQNCLIKERRRICERYADWLRLWNTAWEVYLIDIYKKVLLSAIPSRRDRESLQTELTSS